MRTLALLLAGAAVALSTQVAVGELWVRSEPAAPTSERPVPPTDAGAADVAMTDAPAGFSAFPGTHLPTGVVMAVDENVLFVVPPGFIVMRETASQLQLFTQDVQIAASVSKGARLRGQKPPRQAIEAFAAHNGLAVATIHEEGTNRLIAALTGVTDDGRADEAMLLMHVEPTRRVTVIVRSQGSRVGDPEALQLVDEAFHGRLLMR